MPATKEIIEKLNHLISISMDGKEGYKNAAEDVDDVTLKQLFLQYSSERDHYVKELKRSVLSLGGSPEEEGGTLGSLHRTWMDIKSSLTSGDREAILNACITGEEAAAKAYREASQEESLGIDIRQLITSQLSGIEAALNSIRSLLSVVRT